VYRRLGQESSVKCGVGKNSPSASVAHGRRSLAEPATLKAASEYYLL